MMGQVYIIEYEMKKNKFWLARRGISAKYHVPRSVQDRPIGLLYEGKLFFMSALTNN